MRRSTISLGLLLLVGACAGSTAGAPQPEPAPQAEPQAGPAPQAKPDSPASGWMDTTEIKQGVDKLNPGVLACGQQFGLSSGTRMPVRFVIEGSTGSIAEFEVLPIADADDGLIACIEEVITDAGPGVFPTFAAIEQRFQFNFRMR